MAGVDLSLVGIVSLVSTAVILDIFEAVVVEPSITAIVPVPPRTVHQLLLRKNVVSSVLS